MTLYIACLRGETLANSKPCVHCLQYIKKFHVTKIYYTTEKGWKMEKIRDIRTDHISKGYRK